MVWILKGICKRSINDRYRYTLNHHLTWVFSLNLTTLAKENPAHTKQLAISWNLLLEMERKKEHHVGPENWITIDAIERAQLFVLEWFYQLEKPSKKPQSHDCFVNYRRKSFSCNRTRARIHTKKKATQLLIMVDFCVEISFRSLCGAWFWLVVCEFITCTCFIKPCV